MLFFPSIRLRQITTRRRLHRLRTVVYSQFGAVAASVLVAAGLTVGSTAEAGTTTSSVTVLLKAPHQARLNRLAVAQGLSHAQRVAALRPLLPSAATHAHVVDELRARGFRITHQTAWTIDASGPEAQVASAFGNAPATAGVLPQVPAAISAVTAAVLPRSNAPAIFQPRDLCAGQCHDGQDFRNAYSTPKTTIRTGHDANGPLTIATLQFPLNGGWNSSDLTKYAEAAGLPDPVSSGQYTQIPVDSVTVPGATTQEQGADEEVDLDQETILSTAPLANQRAYFDTSATKAAYTDALSQVLADVTQGTGAVNGGDPKIAALSTSWGACESDFSAPFAFPKDTVKSVGNILKSLTAAGVTIFAASGDDGIYDCADGPSSTRIAVDYPASSPQVVGVGGTRLKYVGNSSANTGSNWVDTGWTCVDAETCQGTKAGDTGASGGGESTLFKLPDYQAAGIGTQRFTTTTGKKGDFGSQPRRLVPDIAVDGDPFSGFEVLTTDPVDVPRCAPPLGPLTCQPKSFAVGGTSLSAPAAAAMFVDMLAAHGATAGVGDIHPALYSAYAAHNGVFRDIKSGRNGNQKDVDSHARNSSVAEIPVNAQRGYDAVTGLGATLWPALAPYLFSPSPATATASLELTDPRSTTHASDVTASWGGNQVKKNGSAPASASVEITRMGADKSVFHTKTAAAAGSHSFAGVPGATYTLTVAVRDLAGQVSAPVSSQLTVPFDDSAFHRHGPWQEVTGASDYGGSRSEVDRAGSFAAIAAKGATYSLEVRTGPGYGKLAIYRGRTHRLGTYDLYSASPNHKIITFFGTPGTADKRRTFRFYATGKKNALSSSARIDIDALIVTPTAN